MKKLFFDWKKINDKAYLKWYEETRESNREECRKEVEAKYGRFYRRYLTGKPVNYSFLNECIRRTCNDYGFEDAVMDSKTFEICVY